MDSHRAARSGRRGRLVAATADERGQASLEVLAGLPALLLAGVIALQLLIAGYSLTLADGAAEAGAIAAVAGRDPVAAARDALPGWARERVSIAEDGGRLTVGLRMPSALELIGRSLEVSSSAWARPPGGA
jgi:hypothetical protein